MNKLDYDELRLDLLSSNDEKEVVIEKDKKKENIYESLRDDQRRVLLDDNKSILKLIWKKDIDDYLQRIKGCGSLVTENREIRYRKELEKFVF